MNPAPLPQSLLDNPRLDRWIAILPDRTVRIATGKVEMGQGVVTAIGQIAADELDLPFERVVVLSGDTTNGPDEQYTTSSLSIQMSGGAVRLVCAEVRAKALERAALRLNCSPADLTVVDGQFVQNGETTGQDYWSVAGEIDLTQAAIGIAADGRRVGPARPPRRTVDQRRVLAALPARRPAGCGRGGLAKSLSHGAAVGEAGLGCL
jgi:CO/xanthine dehydrogenase Mo-binding subunit